MESDYFEQLYAENPDPWGFETRWYESRKYALTLACLPKRHYRTIFEPGCSIGVLSEQLARRCDQLYAGDLVDAAIEHTATRLAGTTAVVGRCDLREGWPDTEPWPKSVELIVLSEVVYYLGEQRAVALAQSVAERLDPDGQLVCVHWRHEVADYPLSGDRADAIFDEHSGLHRLARYHDQDLILTVWSKEPGSVATVEGLVSGP